MDISTLLMTDLVPEIQVTDRRHGDRRQRPTPMFSRYTFFGGRRRAARRLEEQDGSYVDQHGTWLFLAVIAIVVLNLLDAWFTLLFLAHGGRELNPLVDELLVRGGPGLFVLFKTLGIGVCVGFLAITKNFRSARIGIGVVLLGYAALLGWHLHLLAWLNR